jgi:hypothetical protein
MNGFAIYAPIEYRVAPPRQRVKSKRRNLLIALLVVFLSGLLWLLVPCSDPLFHGRPESEWIKSIVYNGSEEQTRQWRDFGPEGVRAIIPAVEKAAQRKDNVGGWAKGALKQIESATPANPGAQK